MDFIEIIRNINVTAVVSSLQKGALASFQGIDFQIM